jgi:hypothetical protein
VHGEDTLVVENTPQVHNLVVCTLSVEPFMPKRTIVRRNQVERGCGRDPRLRWPVRPTVITLR